MKTVLLAADPDSISVATRLCPKPQTAFRLLEATSIEQVMDRFVHSNGKIDLLVIDAAFDSVRSGIDIALNLRFLFPPLKILLTFCGSTLFCTRQQRLALEALPSGALEFLRGPFSPQILLLRIKGLLAAALLKAA